MINAQIHNDTLQVSAHDLATAHIRHDPADNSLEIIVCKAKGAKHIVKSTHDGYETTIKVNRE